MKYKKEFLAEVKREADLLRLYTTPKEKDSLDLSTFDPKDYEFCVYGQISGHCRNTRAMDLIKKCCLKLLTSYTYTDLIDNLCENPSLHTTCVIDTIKKSFNEYNANRWNYFSPIEGYIVIEGADKQGLLNYIKGTTETWKPTINKKLS